MYILGGVCITSFRGMNIPIVNSLKIWLNESDDDLSFSLSLQFLAEITIERQGEKLKRWWRLNVEKKEWREEKKKARKTSLRYRLKRYRIFLPDLYPWFFFFFFEDWKIFRNGRALVASGIKSYDPFIEAFVTLRYIRRILLLSRICAWKMDVEYLQLCVAHNFL